MFAGVSPVENQTATQPNARPRNCQSSNAQELGAERAASGRTRGAKAENTLK